jgi:hypothetical protein
MVLVWHVSLWTGHGLVGRRFLSLFLTHRWRLQIKCTYVKMREVMPRKSEVADCRHDTRFAMVLKLDMVCRNGFPHLRRYRLFASPFRQNHHACFSMQARFFPVGSLNILASSPPWSLLAQQWFLHNVLILANMNSPFSFFGESFLSFLMINCFPSCMNSLHEFPCGLYLPYFSFLHWPLFCMGVDLVNRVCMGLRVREPPIPIDSRCNNTMAYYIVFLLIV